MSTTYPYLGSPGSMQQFPGPSGQIARDPINGPSVTPNMAGGESVLHPLKTRDRFTLPYTSRPGSGFADLLMMFRDGVFGRGPFVYVDPAKSNVLGLDVSTMGVVDGAHGWSATAGAVALDGAQTSPVLGSAVLKWTPSAGGTLSPTLDISTAPVVLSSEYVAVSLYAKAGSAKSTTLAVQGFLANGSSLGGDQATVTAALTTSWQRFTVVASPGLFGPYVLPTLTLAAGSANIWVAGAQLEYASAASSWQRGYRSPRVGITGYPGWLSDKFDGYATHTLVLSEAY